VLESESHQPSDYFHDSWIPRSYLPSIDQSFLLLITIDCSTEAKHSNHPMRTAILALGMVLASRLSGGEPVEFAGYMSSGSDRLFILYDVTAKESSLWMKLGQTWHGYTPASFDAKTEKLTVKHGVTDLVLGLRVTKVHGVQSLLVLGKGSYKLVDGTMVYSPDAKLRLRSNLISSPSGVMVSDSEKKIVAGDLEIERPNGILKVTNGVLTSRDGGTDITGDHITFTTNDGSEITGPHMFLYPTPGEPNEPPNPPPSTVTPPATQETPKP